MNTSLALPPRPSPQPHPLLPEAESSLAALLELFGTEEPAAHSARSSVRSSGARLLAWWRGSARRAARWGAVAGPSVASADRPVRSAVPAVR